MKRVIVLVLSISLIGSIYYIYDNLDNKEDIIIEEDKLKEEFISYTLNGSSTKLSYEELTNSYIVNSITCENGSVGSYDSTRKGISFSKVVMNDSCTINFKEIPGFVAKILTDNPTVSTRTDFSVINISNTTGIIYKTTSTEDGSEVYYYSGNTTNNWVKFGGFYWRIIRTNEDGSVRLLYAGSSPSTTEAYIGMSAISSTNNESKHAGYMYGGNSSLADNRTNTTDSTIKGVIDTWYQNNLLTNYDKYISKTAIYCNDRSIGSGTWSNTGNTFYYGGYTRLYTNKTPTYKCGGNTSGGLFESAQATADKFSASATGGGNGQLTYPIALMTADEVAFAGAVVGTSLSSPYAYYYTNSNGDCITGDTYWFTLTPRECGGGSCFSFGVNGPSYPAYLGYDGNSTSNGVRPVISIDECARVTGTGTTTDPYIINEDESTC